MRILCPFGAIALVLACGLAASACGDSATSAGSSTSDTSAIFSDVVQPSADTAGPGDTVGTADVTAPPVVTPIWAAWSITPLRTVYRPGQTVTIALDVLGDDGSTLTDVDAALRAIGSPSAVAFDAATYKLTFDATTQGRLTLELCVAQTLCSEQSVWVDAGAPALMVTAPLAADELGGDGYTWFQVEGTATDAQPVSVYVNHQPAAQDGDAFVAEVEATFGANHIIVSAIDALGHETTTELDVMWAPAYGPAGVDADGAPAMTAASGMTLRLAQAFFDDGVPLDPTASPAIATDLAGILQLVLPALNLNAFLPGNLGGGTGLTLSNARMLGAEVVIDVTDEGMELFVAIDPVRVNTAGSISVGDTSVGLGGSVDVTLGAFAQVTTSKAGADAPVSVDMTDLVVLVEDLATDFADANADALFKLADSGIRDALEDAAHDALDGALSQALPQFMAQALNSVDLALHDVSVPLAAPFDSVTLALNGRLGALQTRFRDALSGSLTITSAVGDQALHSSRGVALVRETEAVGTVSAGRCGDGRVDPGELCDDGSREGGDGCDTACRPEPGYVCDGATCTLACSGGEVASDGVTTHRYCSRRVAWATADAFCAQQGGALVVIDDPDENALVASFGGNATRWIGATDAASPGSWVAGDGSALSFAAWQDGGADDPDAHCAAMRGDGEWRAYDCASTRRFVCEGQARCGDGVTGPGEACDDGDFDDLNGCTRSCETTLFGAAPVEVAVHLAFINGLLHQLWSAGLLVIDGSTFIGPDLAGLVETATIDGQLPPVVRRGHAFEAAPLTLSIGQLEIALTIAGQTTRYGVRLDAGLTVSMVDNGVDIDVDEAPEIHAWVITSDTSSPLLDGEALETLLLATVWPDMRASLEAVMSLELPLPSIDLAPIAPGLGALDMTLVPVAAPLVRDADIVLRAGLEARLLLLQ